ncbi:MAG: TetR/AcrR family transcriptional regulator [Bacteroidota bacterium]|nr:TetR/AcrR family transcriptional regulator [Bacteroidota bacterium]MDP4230510.1 TetR/AcrR family transcriptional regulator [Bacteroidota bacterium]MDP4237239.1 TetR/AcrR family transcriptional regulator [Bacteroidota bacterium]
MAKRSSIKSRILSVAEEQFRTQGYSQTTMDHLAELLGMSKKTLYEHFRSKQQLAEAMIDDISKAIWKIQDEVIKGDGNPVAKLHRMGQEMQKCLLTVASVKLLDDLRRNAPELWQQIREIRTQKIRQMWSHLLAEGMRKGYIRKELNTEIFVAIHMASVERLLSSDLMFHSEQSFASSRTDLLDIFLNGILTDKGRDAESKYH